MTAPARLDYVQALRALAALAVVTQHIPLYEAGAWGVDLFFIISGFIACYITADSDRKFLTKRVIRVVPLYWLGTFAVFALAFVVPQALNNTTTDPVQLVKSLFFIPFEKGPNVYPVLYLGWTLNYEMLFYLLFALSMRVSFAYRAHVCTALLVALVLAGRFVPEDAVALRFWTSPIILEFALGMFCYLFVKDVLARPATTSGLARGACMAAGIAVVAALPLAYTSLPLDQRALHLGVPSAIAFVLFTYGFAGRRLPAPVVLLGDASYSLYLFHPYAIKLAYRVLGDGPRAPIVDHAVAFALIALCCVLAIACYRLVEHPITRALRRRFVDPSERAANDGARRAPRGAPARLEPR